MMAYSGNEFVFLPEINNKTVNLSFLNALIPAAAARNLIQWTSFGASGCLIYETLFTFLINASHCCGLVLHLLSELLSLIIRLLNGTEIFFFANCSFKGHE